MKGLLLELPLTIISLHAENDGGKSHRASRPVAAPDELWLPGYDNFNRDLFEEDCLRYFKKHVMHRVLQYMHETMPPFMKTLSMRKIILIERTTDSYFKAANATREPEFWTSGQQRRSISNHTELATRLAECFPDLFQNVSLERTSIYYQYKLFKSADILIAQHGGALSNVVFMRDDAHVIEFSPPWGRESNHFLNLAAFKGVGYTRILQTSNHGPVNIEETISAVHQILSSKK